MAQLFDDHERVIPTWLAAARHLLAQPGHWDRNLVLEISQPLAREPYDKQVLQTVNAAMVAGLHDLSIETVASTIFPQSLYTRHGRHDMYVQYHRIIDRAKKPGTWGTYFDRMTRRSAPDGTVVNPLETLIEKLYRAGLPGAKTFQSVFELSPTDPALELAHVAMGEELPTYDPTHDANYLRGGPCLSHLSFKITGKSHVDLTAVYRAHHYCSRALGNLVGLSRLLRFAAHESGLQIGTLTCISSHAELDLASWASSGANRAARGRAVLDQL